MTEKTATHPYLELFCTAEEFAEMIGVKPRMARLICQQGKVEAYYKGRQWLVPKHAARAYERRPVGRPPEVGKYPWSEDAAVRRNEKIENQS